MVSEFGFSANPELLFSCGGFSGIPERLASWGASTVIVSGKKSLKSSGKTEKLIKELKRQGLSFFWFTVGHEADPDTINCCLKEMENRRIHSVCAIGGGSVLDTGKALAAMARQKKKDVELYLEGIGSETPEGKTLPLLAVPTTAGTGSEATRNAVISRPGKGGYKKSLRHEAFVPSAVILDPELACSAPAGVTAACGMDTLSQLLEAFFSTRSNPLTLMYCRQGIRFFAQAFEEVLKDPENTDLRGKMALASYFSGLSLASAGLGTVHGLAGALGGQASIPHGIACAKLLPPVMEITARQLNAKDPAFLKMAEAGFLLTGTPYERAQDRVDVLIQYLNHLVEGLKFPRFASFGVDREGIERVCKNPSNKNNPVALSSRQCLTFMKGLL